MNTRPFEQVAEIDPDSRAYAEGRLGWSEAAVRTGDTEASGLLAVEEPGGGARAWFARDAPTLRVRDGVVSADGPVEELRAASLADALAAVGDRLSPGPPASVPRGWCSWYCHFEHVTAADVLAAAESDLPFEVVQIDDGWQAGIGDWLEFSPRFGDMPGTCARIRARGRRVGIWVAPFLVGARSALARAHPDWVGPRAGSNWGQDCHALDLANDAAHAHLEHVFGGLAALGVDYFKLDFLFAGALAGADAYRQGLRTIRRGVGPAATLLGCGAPLLPSIGLVDAMRVGPDVLAQPSVSSEPSGAAIAKALAVTSARAWMNGRLWVNDPDCLVARPEIPEREAWAAHVAAYGGVVCASDDPRDLDARGRELTLRAFRS